MARTQFDSPFSRSGQAKQLIQCYKMMKNGLMFALKRLFRGQKGLFKVRRNPSYNPHKITREFSIKRYTLKSPTNPLRLQITLFLHFCRPRPITLDLETGDLILCSSQMLWELQLRESCPIDVILNLPLARLGFLSLDLNHSHAFLLYLESP